MNPEREAELISIGMDLGVYAMAQLFASGKYQPTTSDWERFGWNVAKSLELATGRPAEDLVSEVLPVIEKAIDEVFNKPKEEPKI